MQSRIDKAGSFLINKPVGYQIFTLLCVVEVYQMCQINNQLHHALKVTSCPCSDPYFSITDSS